MRHFAIDIETGGLDPKKHSLLEIGIVDSLTGRSLRVLIYAEEYCLTGFCAVMHHSLLKELRDIDTSKLNVLRDRGASRWEAACGIRDYGMVVRKWLDNLGVEGKINVSGKNYLSFDGKWIHSGLVAAGVEIRRRILDPAILYCKPGDEKLPNLATCCERAGIKYDASLAHGAVYDAALIVDLLRRLDDWD